MKKYFLILFLLILLASLSYFGWTIWKKNLPLLSPLDIIESFSPLKETKQTKKIVFGFLPYWNMKYSDSLHIRELSHLAYFGIDLNTDGSIKKLDNPREQEPGWTKLRSPEFDLLRRQIKLTNKKLILVIRVMTREQINAIISDPKIQDQAIDSILSLFSEERFDGINLDFESSGTYSPEAKTNFTSFVKKLTAACKQKKSDCEISIDVFADSAIRNRLYDLPALEPYTDLFIVMAYDFYQTSSNQAGPIAPLRGRCSPSTSTETKCLEYDVTTSMADINKLIPASKIILGVPFYGYQWQTTDTDFLANAYDSSGSLATYKRIVSLLNDSSIASLSATWSSTTLSPYLSFSEDGNTYQIHYENAQSLSLKLDLINQAGLGGLGIWALGYETPYTDLWQTINSKL